MIGYTFPIRPAIHLHAGVFYSSNEAALCRPRHQLSTQRASATDAYDPDAFGKLCTTAVGETNRRDPLQQLCWRYATFGMDRCCPCSPTYTTFTNPVPCRFCYARTTRWRHMPNGSHHVNADQQRMLLPGAMQR